MCIIGEWTLTFTYLSFKSFMSTFWEVIGSLPRDMSILRIFPPFRCAIDSRWEFPMNIERILIINFSSHTCHELIFYTKTFNFTKNHPLLWTFFSWFFHNISFWAIRNDMTVFLPFSSLATHKNNFFFLRYVLL